jgi:hypothetical protein
MRRWLSRSGIQTDRHSSTSCPAPVAESAKPWPRGGSTTRRLDDQRSLTITSHSLPFGQLRCRTPAFRCKSTKQCKAEGVDGPAQPARLRAVVGEVTAECCLELRREGGGRMRHPRPRRLPAGGSAIRRCDTIAPHSLLQRTIPVGTGSLLLNNILCKAVIWPLVATPDSALSICQQTHHTRPHCRQGGLPKICSNCPNLTANF